VIAQWARKPGIIASGTFLVLAACSANSGNAPGTELSAGGSAGDSNGGSAGEMSVPGTGGDDANNPCFADDPNADWDGDGWTIAQGDCNDCSANVNPGAYDFPGNGIDEDCNGIADDEPHGCDVGFPIEGMDARDAARALGLCRFTSEDATGPAKTWGVISAAYVFADGASKSSMPDTSGDGCTGEGGENAAPNALSHSILSAFGSVMPRQGQSMVVLSSGVALPGVPSDPFEGSQMCTKSATPEGIPPSSTSACPDVANEIRVAYDPMALELRVRVPTNAKSFSFDFNFFTVEYPKYICSQYNDFFAALLFSEHPDTPKLNNISFDKLGNPVSVNNGFLEVCDPGTHGGKQFPCPLGSKDLMGTRFQGHGATGWLRTAAAVVPGEEIVVRFAIWDMQDHKLDSTVLIDNIQWEVEEGEAGTERPPLK